MTARLTISSYSRLSSLNLHFFSDTNKYIIIKLFNEELQAVKMFNWYVLKGENNKVIHQENDLEKRSFYIDIVDYEGALLFSNRNINN